MKKWVIDPDHACATFAVRHFMIANVVGLFPKITGTIYVDPPDLAQLSAEVEIEVNSLTTGHQARDEHLRSQEILDAAAYPKILFKTKRIKGIGDNRATADADLTIRGLTRAVSFEFACLGPVKSPFSGKASVGFRGATQIKREDYGIVLDYPMEGGGLVVGREIEITFDLQADLSE